MKVGSMNILWLINVALPESSRLMNQDPIPLGGWLVNASAALAEKNNIILSVSFPKNNSKDVVVLKGKKICYYVFPSVHAKDIISNMQNIYLEKILDMVKPDLVNIFGTEFAHTLDMVNICHNKNIKATITIQGLTSIISQHYLAGLPTCVQNRFTFRDLVKRDNLKQQEIKFKKRGLLEIEALKKTDHIIGRTTWDKACTSQINPKAQYHYCNETLRGEFYKHTWYMDKCEKHSIFVSQGSYPIKGLHFMLEAMPIILKQFPDTKLYIGGQNIIKTDTLLEKLKASTYGKYIKELISKYNLIDNIVFTGVLGERQMCARFLKSHVFVSSSSIENSPNSLGEAMILGVPCVASYVGGVGDMMTHREEGFIYPYDAPYMLAYYVCEIFANDKLALKISCSAKNRAKATHDREKNVKQLVAIYEEIMQET